MRSGWGYVCKYEDESYLIADFDPFVNAHQQYDFMSFELYSRGHRWISDVGRWGYEFKDPKRRFLVSSPAHNVVVPYVDVYKKQLQVKLDASTKQRNWRNHLRSSLLKPTARRHLW